MQQIVNHLATIEREQERRCNYEPMGFVKYQIKAPLTTEYALATLIQQVPKSAAPKSTSGIEARTRPINHAISWQPEQEVPYTLIITDHLKIQNWCKVLAKLNLRVFNVIPRPCIKKNILLTQAEIARVQPQVVIAPTHSWKYIQLITGQCANESQPSDECQQYKALIELLQNKSRTNEQTAEMQRLIENYPYFITSWERNSPIHFIMDCVQVKGVVPQRLIIDGGHSTAKQGIHACFTWIVNDYEVLRSGSYLRSLAVDQFPQVNIQTYVQQVTKHNVILDTRRSQDIVQSFRNIGAAIAQTSEQLNIQLRDHNNTRLNELMQHKLNDACTICTNEYTHQGATRVIFGCCSAHCCGTCYGSMCRYSTQRCFMCRSQDSRLWILDTLDTPIQQNTHPVIQQFNATHELTLMDPGQPINILNVPEGLDSNSRLMVKILGEHYFIRNIAHPTYSVVADLLNLAGLLIVIQ